MTISVTLEANATQSIQVASGDVRTETMLHTSAARFEDLNFDTLRFGAPLLIQEQQTIAPRLQLCWMIETSTADCQPGMHDDITVWVSVLPRGPPSQMVSSPMHETLMVAARLEPQQRAPRHHGQMKTPTFWTH